MPASVKECPCCTARSNDSKAVNTCALPPQCQPLKKRATTDHNSDHRSTRPPGRQAVTHAGPAHTRWQMHRTFRRRLCEHPPELSCEPFQDPKTQGNSHASSFIPSLRGHRHALAPQMGMPCREPFLVTGAYKAARFPPTETTLSREPRGIDT